jgi:DNA-binding transcriptional MerR regulator
MSEKINILDQDELDYINNSKYKLDYPGLSESMDFPRFTINDLGVTARDATYWAKKEILPELIGTITTRRKYTLKQAVWIKLIQQLRSFDVSLIQIKKIKEHLLMPNVNFKDLMQMDQVKLILQNLLAKNGKIEEYRELMKTTSFMDEMEKEQVDVFEIMVLYAIIFRRDVSYLVTVDGYCLPYVYDKHESMKSNVPDFDILMKSPHIMLSLSQAYSQLIQDWSEKKWFNDVSIVSKDEKKILSLLREQKFKEIRIMKNGQDLDRVILISEKPVDAIQEFANHIVRNGYQTITISTRQGKPVHFKNEVSIN